MDTNASVPGWVIVVWSLFFFLCILAIVLSNVIRETKAISDWSVFQSAFFFCELAARDFPCAVIGFSQVYLVKKSASEEICHPPADPLVPRVYALQTLHSSWNIKNIQIQEKIHVSESIPPWNYIHYDEVNGPAVRRQILQSVAITRRVCISLVVHQVRSLYNSVTFRTQLVQLSSITKT